MPSVRVATPEIRLHCGPTGLNEAVLSLDFLWPNNEVATSSGKSLLATGGADKEIKLWRVGEKEEPEAQDTIALEFVFSLSGHDRSVNCVRFSPNGAYLASASDDTSIILWSKPKTAGDDWHWDQISSLSDVKRNILSLGHKGDITDLSWSPDSAFLASTSVDNRCVIWDVEKGDVAERRKDHTQYVQGVAWDPLNEFIVTEGNDRTCRVYSLSGFGAGPRLNMKKQGRKFMCIQTLKTRDFSPERHNERNLEAKNDKDKEESSNSTVAEATLGDVIAKTVSPPKHRMFLDDTCPAFARRPAWTPDGNYFLAPTGMFRSSDSASAVNTVYAFSRGNLSQPTLHLPGQEKTSLAVRCSPVMYKLRCEGEESSVFNLFKTELRSVFAVITLDAVIVHDTQHSHPICTIKGLHYADLTDASWTADGQTLSISSTDGYISFIRFEAGFFGTSQPYRALNEVKMRRMFATPNKARKKPRSQTQSQSGLNTLTPAKVTVGKTKTPAVDPVAHQGSEEKPAANSVNVLQVRKKRKTLSTPAQVDVTSASAAVESQAVKNAPLGIKLASSALVPSSSSAEDPTTGSLSSCLEPKSNQL
ncbi:chromatin assembly complex 1 subunit b cac2 [Plasmopara halstedii]|uniref:Chromatin assembly complex 1 subunit b cac2 n=1 Tax=Plasmopara halstedii TaxID=4781 RepID=A0A0P1B6K6_PLAHL|nr:chromatin assembly complex 1 subunit b cac2 [Plasmopara halstedii]CEG50470.1 chromatin assembly complex 1 subunit b cac2 [Plasmopara halstedii]|eukprot:XP_024586839.1 chromatin assembly complex 1 subunit b cac2 [Plasmopara halstedii]